LGSKGENKVDSEEEPKAPSQSEEMIIDVQNGSWHSGYQAIWESNLKRFDAKGPNFYEADYELHVVKWLLDFEHKKGGIYILTGDTPVKRLQDRGLELVPSMLPHFADNFGPNSEIGRPDDRGYIMSNMKGSSGLGPIARFSFQRMELDGASRKLYCEKRDDKQPPGVEREEFRIPKLGRVSSISINPAWKKEFNLPRKKR
jgi:hypothetical protein